MFTTKEVIMQSRKQLKSSKRSRCHTTLEVNGEYIATVKVYHLFTVLRTVALHFVVITFYLKIVRRTIVWLTYRYKYPSYI